MGQTVQIRNAGYLRRPKNELLLSPTIKEPRSEAPRRGSAACPAPEPDECTRQNSSQRLLIENDHMTIGGAMAVTSTLLLQAAIRSCQVNIAVVQRTWKYLDG